MWTNPVLNLIDFIYIHMWTKATLVSYVRPLFSADRTGVELHEQNQLIDTLEHANTE